MKRKGIILMIIAVLVFGVTFKANAETSVYYTTPNGIELTEEEYRFLTTFYWEEYVDNMTEEQYREFAESDLLERRFITASTEDNMCRSDFHSTNFKTLRVSAACSNYCTVSLVAIWKANPTVRSYDDIGYFLSGLSLLSYTQATVSDSTGTTYFSNYKTEYASLHDAIGNSVLLSSGNNLVINQVITTTTNGHIYGSYQHATQTVTLPVSKSYTFSLGGYGNVFLFNGNAVGKYDGMAGVDIAV